MQALAIAILEVKDLGKAVQELICHLSDSLVVPLDLKVGPPPKRLGQRWLFYLQRLEEPNIAQQRSNVMRGRIGTSDRRPFVTEFLAALDLSNDGHCSFRSDELDIVKIQHDSPQMIDERRAADIA